MIIINNENSLIDCLNYVESFDFFNNGNVQNFTVKSEKFFVIKNNLKEMFINSRLMPAFGVSLHNETLKELKNGEWLKINFAKEINKNGLPFTSLLFKLEDTQGLNLIRLYNNKFDGRCLYLDLNCETDLLNLVK